MSTTDSFIDEVSEAVRKDRLYAAFRKWGWIGVLLVLLIVGGAAWYEWQKARNASAAQARGEALLVALSAPDAEARAAALDATGDEGAVARLLEAGQSLLAGDRVTALTTLDALAGDASQPQIYRDLARLRALIIDAGNTPPAARIAALQTLAQPNGVFAPMAQEQIALAQIEAGDIAGARQTLETILADAATPQGLAQRATALVAALDAPSEGEGAEQDWP